MKQPRNHKVNPRYVLYQTWCKYTPNVQALSLADGLTRGYGSATRIMHTKPLKFRNSALAQLDASE